MEEKFGAVTIYSKIKAFTFQNNIFKQTLNCAPRKVLEEKKALSPIWMKRQVNG